MGLWKYSPGCINFWHQSTMTHIIIRKRCLINYTSNYITTSHILTDIFEHWGPHIRYVKPRKLIFKFWPFLAERCHTLKALFHWCLIYIYFVKWKNQMEFKIVLYRTQASLYSDYSPFLNLAIFIKIGQLVPEIWDFH